jgi:hypothetical protein
MKKIILLKLILIISFLFPTLLNAWNTFSFAYQNRMVYNYFPFSQVKDSIYYPHDRILHTADSLANGGYPGSYYEFSDVISWFVVDKNYNKFVATLKDFFFLPTIGERINLITKYGLKIIFPIDHIELDSKQNVWFTSKNGLWYFNRMEDKISKKLDFNITGKMDSVRILRIDKEDNAWLVKDKKSIYRFQDDSLHKFDLGQLEDSLYSIYQIRFDENNFLWFCSLNGLFKHDGNVFQNYNSANNNFPTDTILDFEWERPDKMWCVAYHKIFYSDLKKSIDTIGYYELWKNQYNSASKVWIDSFKNKYFLIDGFSESNFVSVLWIYNEEDISFTGVKSDLPTLCHSSISPNPVSNFARLKLDNEFSGIASISIVDLLGNSNVIYSGDVSGGVPLNLDFSAFPTGFYSLIVDYGTKREVVKVIKE